MDECHRARAGVTALSPVGVEQSDKTTRRLRDDLLETEKVVEAVLVDEQRRTGLKECQAGAFDNDHPSERALPGPVSHISLADEGRRRRLRVLHEFVPHLGRCTTDDTLKLNEMQANGRPFRCAGIRR